MQHELITAPVVATIGTDAGPTPDAPTAAVVAKPKRARKPASKPKAAKPVAKPAPVADTSDRNAERAAAAAAVSAYYGGRSLPFKSASDRFADLRLDKQPKAATQRQAALLAAMLAADTAGNIKPDGSFVRGGFKLPARLFDPKAPAEAVVSCQPETGCLSDALGRVVSYVSGPTAGKAQRDTVLRVDLKRARAEISAHIGDKLGKLAIKRIDALAAAA